MLARPDDDSPRLACASRLETLGDVARAELIRAQCAYAALPAGAPERATAWAPIATLVKQHAATWLTGLERVASARSFWRGFVESTDGTMEDYIACAAALEREAPLASTTVEPAESEAVAAQFCDLALLERVRTLELSEGATGADAARVLESPRLVSLGALSMFDPSGFPAAAAPLAAAIPPALRTLSVVGFMTTDFDDRAAAVIAGSPAVASLEHLRLWNCNLREAGARAIASSPHLVRLRSLWLGLGQYTLNKIGAAGCAAFADRAALPQLETLDLDFNAVGDAGWRPVVDSGKLARFVELRLQACALTDESIVPMFTGAARPDLLVTLDLSHNKLGAATARAIADARPAALRTLWLYANPIGDDGVAAIADAPWLGQLDELNLQQVGLTDAGAEALIRSPHLDGVRRVACDFQRPRLSAPTVARLKERLGSRWWSPSVTKLRAS